MSPIEIADELERLAMDATPGPWGVGDWHSDNGAELTTIYATAPEIMAPGTTGIWPQGVQKFVVAETNEGVRPLEDAALIAFYRNHHAALVAGLRGNAWQPIETAPKTGEALLLACVDGRIAFGFYGWGGATAQGENTWRDGVRWKPITPTHWRPYPKHPPTLSQPNLTEPEEK